jgi:pimeloyl-ACP methyl ester carboxylesterase
MKITSFDGAHIHVTIMGKGRDLLLIHGFISSAKLNWIDYGTAKLLADAGFRVIMPDLRGHGSSDGDCAYPIDVLHDDMRAVVDHFALIDYDLVGYSLGARTAARLAAQRPPHKLILAGMGYSGMMGVMERRDWFIDAIKNRAAPKDSAGARVASFLKSMHMDADVAIAVLMSQAAITEADLQQLTMPTLILAGAQDEENGSITKLAAALPNAASAQTPGNHMSAITKGEFGAAIQGFLLGENAFN